MELKRGAKTKIVAGPFKDSEALILEKDSMRDMVLVEVDIAGKKSRMDLSPNLLEHPVMDPIEHFRNLLRADQDSILRARHRHWWKQFIYYPEENDLPALYLQFQGFKKRIEAKFREQFRELRQQFESEFSQISDWKARREKWMLEERRWQSHSFKETYKIRELNELEDQDRQIRLQAELIYMARDQKNRLAETLWKEAEYEHWKKKRLPPAEKMKKARSEALSATQAKHSWLAGLLLEKYGLFLPRHLLTFYAFYISLPQKQREFLHEGPLFKPVGIFDLFSFKNRPSTFPFTHDLRLHHRYYNDPPEFLSLVLSGPANSRFGLWYDEPLQMPTQVKYLPEGQAGLHSRGSTTLLEELRLLLSDQIREVDWFGDPTRYFMLLSLMEAVNAFESPEITPNKASKRLCTRTPTLDHCSVWVENQEDQESRDLLNIKNLILSDDPGLSKLLAQAEKELKTGNAIPMLALGRDLHWLSKGVKRREVLAAELLHKAYAAVGRKTFADIVRLHFKLRTSEVNQVKNELD